MGLNCVRYFDYRVDNFDEIIAMDRCKLNERNVYKLEWEEKEGIVRYVQVIIHLIYEFFLEI